MRRSPDAPSLLRDSRVLRFALALAGASLLAGANCTPRQPAVLVASGFAAPITMSAPLGDARLFVVQRGGLVRIVKNGSVLSTPFLDLSSRIENDGEEGLLGIAFPDDYAQSREFYVYYIDLQHDSVLSRFLADPNNADRALPTSEQVVLRVDQPAGSSNHKGGTIAFSPDDGMLYWALGDGGSTPASAQNPQSLLGKMLRLDVGGTTATYTIPPDNPFRSTSDGIRDEIWAFGFRNPFRFGFDRDTGDLYIGDVGQGQREEVDFEPAGDPGGNNYGWSTHEGTLCYQPTTALPCENPAAPNRFTFPLYEYDTHAGGNCAITGGVVYRGSAGWLEGQYLFSDYCSSRIWSLMPDGTVRDLTAQIAPTQGSISGVVAIAEDGFGDVYVVSIGSGQLHRLR